MQLEELNTSAENTWCPGCGNFGILSALKTALSLLTDKGVKKETFVLVGDIGCGSKITDYLNINSFYSLHGRAIAVGEGIKLGNPHLNVIVSMGDGGVYDEGISHLIHAAKRNSDILLLVHDNRNFALTTSQFTATSPYGFKGRSTPEGSIEYPINPLELMLASGATFIARSYSAKLDHLTDLIVKGIQHKGFSFIEVLQPCPTFFNTYEQYNKTVYEVKETDLDSKEKALQKIQEWDYNREQTKIPIGIFYKIQKPTYNQLLFENLN